MWPFDSYDISRKEFEIGFEIISILATIFLVWHRIKKRAGHKNPAPWIIDTKRNDSAARSLLWSRAGYDEVMQGFRGHHLVMSCFVDFILCLACYAIFALFTFFIVYSLIRQQGDLSRGPSFYIPLALAIAFFVGGSISARRIYRAITRRAEKDEA